MGAVDTMVKSCLGERLKRSILVHILLNKDLILEVGPGKKIWDGSGTDPGRIQDRSRTDPGRIRDG